MDGVSLGTLSFYLLAALAVLGGCGVAFTGNIVYSALSLMVSFFGVAGLYVLLQADFVAGVQVLVYVGGVLVLTLFAVMLTHQIADIEVSNRSVARLPAIALSAAAFAVLVHVLRQTTWFTAAEPGQAQASTYGIGNALLREYVLPFELASMVLLAVLVGAVVLSRKEVSES